MRDRVTESVSRHPAVPPSRRPSVPPSLRPSVPPSLRRLLAGLGLVALLACSGCPAVSDLPAPGRVSVERDPVQERAYHMYVPSYYHEERSWPLLVACHGTPPFDTGESQLDQWKGWAEARGFLVVAPELAGTSALATDTEAQLRLQRQDEEAMLSIVQSVRASRRVERDQVFLTGWSAGGYAVLYTGLRHPEVFRALAVSQGNFRAELVEACAPFLDRYQPVMLLFGSADPLKEDALACIDWLRRHDVEPDVVERPGIHRRDPEPIFRFFEDVVKHRPMVRVLVQDDPDDPMRVTFRVAASFEPVRYLWDFGDGEQSPVAWPEHVFAKPGLYAVRVAVWPTKGKQTRYVRQVQIQAPRIRLGAAAPATTAQ